jgi:putative N6-adenine-specific DNA methylase
MAPRSTPTRALAAFAATAPGLAPITAAELTELGIRPREVDASGVAFDATQAELQRANLWLRTASRVTVRLAQFRAEAFHELERHARQVPWERVLDGERPVRLRVTCRKSRLYHSDAVAERVADAIAHRVGGAGGYGRAGEDDADAEHGVEEGAQLFVVRFFHDRCTISADSSGALLHRRGYRQALAKAPLRETLAAAMLLAAGWDGRAPLVDPMCGSGTIPIEGALIARRLAPGRQRRFAFMDWPGFDAAAWRAALAAADERALPAAPAPIVGSDRDAGAVRATRENAERAGVVGDLTVEHHPLSALAPPLGPGWLVTNPPYGKRIGDPGPLRELWTRLGEVARTRCPGWTVAILSPDRRLDALTRLRLEERLSTRNGGIPVWVMAGTVDGAR